MTDIHSAESPASSINTSLLPTDSDDDEEIVRWQPPPRPPLPYKEPDRRKLVIYGIWAVAGFILCLLFVPVIFLHRPHVGQLPTSRKAASMAAFSVNINTPLGKSLVSSRTSTSEQESSHDVLLVWSGMGHHRRLQNDTYVFDLHTRLWTKLSFGGGKHSTRQIHPDPRWKAATSASNQPPGLLVALGEVENGEGKRKLDEDMWMLGLPDMKWESANVSECSAMRPEARRSHSAVSIEGDGQQTVVVFGGVLANTKDLDETWIARIQWPNVTWERLQPKEITQRRSSNGIEQKNSFSGKSLTSGDVPLFLPGPPARHGHAAAVGEVYIDGYDKKKNPSSLQMIIFGGRDSTQYFNDIWALDLNDSGEDSYSWKEIQVDDASPLPPPRAHHAVAVYNERLYVWGGLSGPTFASSKPLDDLWVFNFATRLWSKATVYGAQPLPRFLFSSALHTPAGLSVPRLYIFGGETLERCKLNDVWSLDMENLKWDLLAPNVYWKRRCDRLFGGGYRAENTGESKALRRSFFK